MLTLFGAHMFLLNFGDVGTVHEMVLMLLIKAYKVC